MPYYDVYIPSPSKRLIELFRLHRWCWKCNDWEPLLHIHRGPIRTQESGAPPEETILHVRRGASRSER